jgi:two-component system sensor histidine kinase SenX3
LRREATNLRALLDEALDRGRLYAARKAISIEFRAVDAPIVADKELLSYAVYNLLTNAVKYSPKQTIVRLDADVLNGDVTICVTDQGYGVAPEERTRIFQRFYRAQRDKAGPEQGAGIGLALVKEIAELHGGRVDVESRPGVGSRFTIRIPHTIP